MTFSKNDVPLPNNTGNGPVYETLVCPIAPVAIIHYDIMVMTKWTCCIRAI